jgi:SRSO17 transposase
LGDAGYGDGTEFREELERRQLKYAVGVLPQVGVWLKPPKIIPLQTTGKGRPRTASRYGDQRPTTAQEAATQAKAWRKIRWREGTKGWLESRFWATVSDHRKTEVFRLLPGRRCPRWCGA